MASPSIAVRLGRHIAPLRFLVFMAIFVASGAAFVPQLGLGRGAMAAFDLASAVFLILILGIFNAEPGRMRTHARDNDANRALLLAISIVVTLVVLVAVASEMHAKSNTPEVLLVVGTLALSWLFSNTVFALHYAHLFYLADAKGEDRQGLSFPDTVEPDYWDFAYFSFTLGMTFQTSDVEIDSARIRRVVLAHSMAAFVFNIGVLAFTINVLGGS